MHPVLRVTRALLLLLLIVVLAFAAGIVVSDRFLPAAPQAVTSEEIPDKFDLLDEVWHILSQRYVDKEALDAEELSEGAIRGMLEALGDPYTTYVDAERYELELTSFHGSFEGIGAAVSMEEGELLIVSPIANSPAERAGIRRGDKILEVDGEPILGMTLVEAVNTIRGPRGTEVRLTILHQGELEPVEMVIVRDEIKTDSVYPKMLSENIAYIWITHFSDRTSSELEAALKDIRESGAAGIILDLRGNPGGLLTASVEVASQFLKEGIVVYQVDSEGERREWNVKSGGLATDIPLAVLVDQGSASGSEVVAGALQDAGRGPLIGQRTFGKGDVWEFHELSDGSAVTVTTARWYTPKGRLIQGEGLEPDFEVEFTEADLEKGVDPQLERAIDYIENREVEANQGTQNILTFVP